MLINYISIKMYTNYVNIKTKSNFFLVKLKHVKVSIDFLNFISVDISVRSKRAELHSMTSQSKQNFHYKLQGEIVMKISTINCSKQLTFK